MFWMIWNMNFCSNGTCATGAGLAAGPVIITAWEDHRHLSSPQGLRKQTKPFSQDMQKTWNFCFKNQEVVDQKAHQSVLSVGRMWMLQGQLLSLPLFAHSTDQG